MKDMIIDRGSNAALPLGAMLITVAACSASGSIVPTGTGGATTLGSGGSSTTSSSSSSTTSSSSSSSSTTSSSSSSTTSSTGGVVNHSIGGSLHFLQSGSVQLSNGSDMVMVSADGSFAFPTKQPVGATYQVAISAQPAGQSCWVQNGGGTVAGDVTDVDVRCATVLRSATPAGGAAVSTTSSALVPISDIPPITFTNDIPSMVLLSLRLPDLATDQTVHSIGFQLDGVTVGLTDGQNNTGPSITGTTLAVQQVAAGTHTLVPVWSTPGKVGDYANLMTSEMDAVLLDSLPSYDQTLSSTLAATAGSTTIAKSQTTPVAMGFTPLAPVVSGAAEPTFAWLMASDVLGDRQAVNVVVDGTPFGAGVAGFDVNAKSVRSFTPMSVLSLSPGAHTIDASWFTMGDGNVPITRGGNGLASTLNAVLFKSATPSASQVWAGAQTIPLTTTFTAIGPSLSPPQPALMLTLAKASKVLLTFSATNFRAIPNWPQSADAAFFVNGVQGPMVRGWDANNIDWGCQGISFAGIVDAPAGTSTIEVRVRVGTDSSSSGATLQLDNMLAGGNQVGSIGAIALD